MSQTPKIGQKVAVCYDGKWGRRVEGIVTGTKQKSIRVRFKDWVDGKEAEAWLRKNKRRKKYGGAPSYFCGYVRDVDWSLHRNMFGLPGDYYSTAKWKPVSGAKP
jgi:hypothetical protein